MADQAHSHASEQRRDENQQQRIHSVLFQVFQVVDVQVVELLADLEHEYAEYQDADQDVERDPKFDDHRHAIGGCGRGKKQTILHRQKTDDLRHGFGPRDHHHE